jgi:GDP-mannose 6-dehydrogenase
VQLIKRLIAEGCQVKIWDDYVSLGRLMGSNRQYIDEVIPHIGSLLCERVVQVVGFGDVIVLATKALD